MANLTRRMKNDHICSFLSSKYRGATIRAISREASPNLTTLHNQSYQVEGIPMVFHLQSPGAHSPSKLNESIRHITPTKNQHKLHTPARILYQ
jgi:hypothetical protein